MQSSIILKKSNYLKLTNLHSLNKPLKSCWCKHGQQPYELCLRHRCRKLRHHFSDAGSSSIMMLELQASWCQKLQNAWHHDAGGKVTYDCQINTETISAQDFCLNWDIFFVAERKNNLKYKNSKNSLLGTIRTCCPILDPLPARIRQVVKVFCETRGWVTRSCYRFVRTSGLAISSSLAMSCL